MADTTAPETALYQMSTDVEACEAHGAHQRGDRLRLTPDNILVQSGCAKLVPDAPAPKPKTKA